MNQPDIKVTVEHHFRTESESDFQRFVKDLELNVLRWICAGESAIVIVDRMKDQLTEHRENLKERSCCCFSSILEGKAAMEFLDSSSDSSCCCCPSSIQITIA